MNEEWIDAGDDEIDADLLAEANKIIGKIHPDPLTPEGFIFILDEIESRDWTWTLTKMHVHTTMNLYYSGYEALAVHKNMYRAVFLCYLDVLIDLKNRQLL